MSSLDRKYKAGGGEVALLLTLLFALVGIPAILYVVASAGHADQGEEQGKQQGDFPAAGLVLAVQGAHRSPLS